VDIYLYPEAFSRTDIILSNGPRSVAVIVEAPAGGAGWRKRRRPDILIPLDVAPVAVSLHQSLTDQYGELEGSEVWSKMLVGRQGPFAEGAKYDPKKRRVRKKLRDAGLGPLIEE
jgi:hypothetical protein